MGPAFSGGGGATALALPLHKSILAIAIGAAGALLAARLAPPELAAPGCILAFGLAWAAMIDSDRFVLPDALTLGLLIAGLLVSLGAGVAAAAPNIAGAAAGYLSLAFIAWSYRRIRGRHGLGLGDAKLLAAGGAWLGWTALPFVLLAASMACLTGQLAIAMWSRRPVSSDPIPFGPFLAAGIWLVWIVQASGRT